MRTNLNYRSIFARLILLMLSFFLLIIASSSFWPLITLLCIVLLTYAIINLIDSISSKKILQLVGYFSVPAGFILIIILYFFGYIGTLTGSASGNTNGYSFAFIALPFYSLSASALISDTAANKLNRSTVKISFFDALLYITMPFKLLSGPLESPALIDQIKKFTFHPRLRKN